MFLIDCSSHGRPILLTAARIRGLRNTDHGILLELECWCGTRAHLTTGRNAPGVAVNRSDPRGRSETEDGPDRVLHTSKLHGPEPTQSAAEPRLADRVEIGAVHV